MQVSNFFTRLLQPPKEAKAAKLPDDLGEFDTAWQGIKETLEHPDERQIIRGIASTSVPSQLRHIVDALVYESNRTDEDTTGACLEYFLKNDLLGQLEKLCEPDRPHGIKAEVLRAINNLIVSLSERFLVHNAVHRPLRRLLRSCVGEEPEDKVDGSARVVGAAGMNPHLDRRGTNDNIEEDLVGLMCTLASRMVAYPPLLLIFFHDKGWLQPHPIPSSAPSERALSPAPSAHTGVSGPSSKVSAHHFEFLLFSYLLRFVHREGQVGDPARAGLLFLFDIAFLPSKDIGSGSPQLDNKDVSDPLQDARDALGEFILDGDFAEVMAAGLGAIYSLLPSKLHIPSLAEISVLDKDSIRTTDGGMHLGASKDLQEEEMTSSTDNEVRDQLDLILKLFGFLQDIIHRCTSAIHNPDADSTEISTTHILGSAIAEATLDAIQSSFFDNILYPSILECSNHDGSSVAVLSYLDVLLSNLDDGPLSDRLLSFLTDSGSTNAHLSAAEKKKNKRKTGAMGFIDQPSISADYFAAEGRFTLKDLILDNLNSTQSASSTAALRLLRTLLSDHCQQSVKGLLSIVRDPAATALAKRPIPFDMNDTFQQVLPQPVNPLDAHLQEVELYSSLVTRLDPNLSSAEMAAGYATYLTDMTAWIESDRCFRLSNIPTSFLGDYEKVILRSEMPEELIQHRLSPSDTLIKSILGLLGTFMTNSPDANVALTGVLDSIALCPTRSLAGWLLYDIKPDQDPWTQPPSHRKADAPGLDSDSDVDSDVDSDRHATIESARDPFGTGESATCPAMYQILRNVVQTISNVRDSIESFDQLLLERRQGLLFTDHLDEAMNIMLDVDSSSVFGLPETPKSDLKKKRPSATGLVGGIKSFLTPKKKAPTPLGTPNRSSGRTPTLGTLGNLFAPGNSASSKADPNVIDTPPRRLLSPSPNLETPGHTKTPIKVDELDMISPAPFKSHYEQSDIEVTLGSVRSTTAIEGPWQSKAAIERETRSLGFDAELSSIHTPTKMAFDHSHEGDDVQEGDKGEDGPRKVNLNLILDNCVILEEFIKELVAIITARRAMGIDQVGFV
ncbi:uncharacterized protein I303_105207 [Kwoniella dejecticola CBS 10117]|uniref:Retinoic acid induced 16-like protein-domain-containing protein n=1 Tax=Kwoniella dejecticola CBS 10117 TaxID=1296121 RepID=A0A1A6A354_9TREE|nr:uncharacterized protein I303_05346 [Kwoniella dejecticola CBS 10117]OBR84488.1 hypothetical protein I303_05346 [Kwoniella dejecticola CBS 10117]